MCLKMGVTFCPFLRRYYNVPPTWAGNRNPSVPVARFLARLPCAGRILPFQR
jgi:hypothetical protein